MGTTEIVRPVQVRPVHHSYYHRINLGAKDRDVRETRIPDPNIDADLFTHRASQLNSNK